MSPDPKNYGPDGLVVSGNTRFGATFVVSSTISASSYNFLVEGNVIDPISRKILPFTLTLSTTAGVSSLAAYFTTKLTMLSPNQTLILRDVALKPKGTTFASGAVFASLYLADGTSQIDTGSQTIYNALFLASSYVTANTFPQWPAPAIGTGGSSSSSTPVVINGTVFNTLTTGAIGARNQVHTVSTNVRHFQVWYPKGQTGVLSVFFGNVAGAKVAELAAQQGFAFDCASGEVIDISSIYVSSTVATDSYTGAFEA